MGWLHRFRIRHHARHNAISTLARQRVCDVVQETALNDAAAELPPDIPADLRESVTREAGAIVDMLRPHAAELAWAYDYLDGDTTADA